MYHWIIALLICGPAIAFAQSQQREWGGFVCSDGKIYTVLVKQDTQLIPPRPIVAEFCAPSAVSEEKWKAAKTPQTQESARLACEKDNSAPDCHKEFSERNKSWGAVTHNPPSTWFNQVLAEFPKDPEQLAFCARMVHELKCSPNATKIEFGSQLECFYKATSGGKYSTGRGCHMQISDQLLGIAKRKASPGSGSAIIH